MRFSFCCWRIASYFPLGVQLIDPACDHTRAVLGFIMRCAKKVGHSCQRPPTATGCPSFIRCRSCSSKIGMAALNCLFFFHSSFLASMIRFCTSGGDLSKINVLETFLAWVAASSPKRCATSSQYQRLHLRQAGLLPGRKR